MRENTKHEQREAKGRIVAYLAKKWIMRLASKAVLNGRSLNGELREAIMNHVSEPKP